MPAGFFRSAAGGAATNGLIVVLYVGIASLTLGVVSLGIGMLAA